LPQIELQKHSVWVKATQILCRGRFDLIPALIENDLPHYKFIFNFGKAEEEYKELLQGICGLFSYKDNN
jgi:hypothetical protein